MKLSLIESRLFGRICYGFKRDKWIDLTNAIGILSKQGKSGGTMAHPFIACDFEMRNDAEFRFEVVRAFINSRTEIQNEIE